MNENWEIVTKGARKKVFNEFFLDWKTQAEVVDDVYGREGYDRSRKQKAKRVRYLRVKNTGYTSRSFKKLKKLHYLDGPEMIEKIGPRTSKKGKTHDYHLRKRRCYRANLRPFFEWLDAEIQKEKADTTGFYSQMDPQIASNMKQILTKYLKEFFKSLDENGVPRNKIMKDKNVDIITTIQSLILTIERYVAGEYDRILNECDIEDAMHIASFSSIYKSIQGRGIKGYYPEIPLKIEKEEGVYVYLPSPSIFFNPIMRNFIEIVFIPINFKVETFQTSSAKGYAREGILS